MGLLMPKGKPISERAEADRLILLAERAAWKRIAEHRWGSIADLPMSIEGLGAVSAKLALLPKPLK